MIEVMIIAIALTIILIILSIVIHFSTKWVKEKDE